MRNQTFILVVALLVVLFVGAGGLYVYDASREDIIAEGVNVNGIELGGLTPEKARSKLERSVVEAYSAPVIVQKGRKEFALTPRRARVDVNVDAMVDEALERSREGGIFSRTWRALTGDEAHANIPPRVTFSERVVARFVDKVADKLERKPRDATIKPSTDELTRVGSRSGVRVDERELRRDIADALGRAGGERVINVDFERVKPRVTTRELADKYPTYIVVDRKDFKLRLYKNLKLKKVYPIAVGAAGFDTPVGLYNITNKAVNPAWSVPNSGWAGELAGQTIPGGAPNNPLKARWLGVYDGVGVHGTAERDSIGTKASHGCIRMLVEDVVELYDQVPVGTPIYIA